MSFCLIRGFVWHVRHFEIYTGWEFYLRTGAVGFVVPVDLFGCLGLTVALELYCTWPL